VKKLRFKYKEILHVEYGEKEGEKSKEKKGEIRG